MPSSNEATRMAGFAALAILAAGAAPALAQEQTDPISDLPPPMAKSSSVEEDARTAEGIRRQRVRDTPSKLSGDHLIVAVGTGYTPDYVGSDDYKVRFGGAFRGSYKGVGFASKGLGLSLDLVPELDGDIGFSFGPTVRYRANRSGSVKDPVVDLLPDLPKTVEAGIDAGISFSDILTSYDNLSIGGEIRWDVSGKGAGRIIDTSINYVTALGPGTGAAISVGMDFVNDDYADFYYTVDAAGSAATGGALPVYLGEGGTKNRTARLYFARDFDNNFRNGGWGAVVSGGYTQLRGSAAETPITALRGDRDQFSALAAVGYLF